MDTGGSSKKTPELIISDFPGICNVDAALNKLKELAFQTMKEDGFISEEQLQEFESLADEIADLARQRDEIHDALEVETIKTSKQRNAIQLLPGQFRREMEEAVLAARGINGGEMKGLSEKLKSVKEENASHDKEIQQLTTENINMKPECDAVRKEHDEIIALLNKRMSVKSNKQIALNETRDKLRVVREQTSEIDIGLLNLEDDMKEHRSEAEGVKADLNVETKQTEKEITEQTEANNEEKKIIDSYLEQGLDRATRIAEQRKVVGRLENSMTRLEMDALQLTDKIERERRNNEEVAKSNEKLKVSYAGQEAQYNEKIDVLQKKIALIRGELSTAEQEDAEILNEKDVVHLCTNRAHDTKTEHSTKVKLLANNVASMKKEANRLTEEHSSKQQDNNKILEELETLQENHKATIELYETQIEELQTTADQEKHERVKTEKQRDDSEKVLDDFTSKHGDYMAKMTRELNSASAEHQKLSEKSLFLTRDTEDNRKRIETLQVKLEVAQSSMVRMKSSLEQELQRITANIELLKKDNKKKQEYYNEKIPQVEEIRRESEARSMEYNQHKKDVITIRNKEKGLIEKKKRSMQLIDKLNKPMEELKGKITTKRTEGVEQLQSNSQRHTALENDIYCVTHQLQKIMHENQVMRDSCEDLEDEIRELRADTRAHAGHPNHLYEELKNIELLFTKAWDHCMELEEESSSHDHLIRDGISTIQKDTKERSLILSDIAKDLKFELDSLTSFVENVEDRRPRDTRESRRRLNAAQRRNRTPWHQ